jgi:prephenate dehydratase
MYVVHIAIQGQLGSFHHQVATQWFGDDVQILPAETFDDVFGMLNRHETTKAIVAIENSLYGSINDVYDLIESHRYPIVGEVYLRIEQQLISLPDAKPADITHVYSHPVALAQCEHYLDTHFPNAERIEHHDTAASVEFIKNKGDKSMAAIAGRVAAELYDLPILAENIEDNKANYTRFLILDASPSIPIDANKTSLVIQTDHKPGALAQVLTTFADAGINLTKLQSRPIIGKVWQYRFYIDVEASGEKLHSLVHTIKQNGTTVTILGEYKSAELSD